MSTSGSNRNSLSSLHSDESIVVDVDENIGSLPEPATPGPRIANTSIYEGFSTPGMPNNNNTSVCQGFSPEVTSTAHVYAYNIYITFGSIDNITSPAHTYMQCTRVHLPVH